MKKKIVILMLSFLLIGVNLYAAGDLIVNGTLGVGSSAPTGTKAEIVADSTTGGLGDAVKAYASTNNTNGRRAIYAEAKNSLTTGTANYLMGLNSFAIWDGSGTAVGNKVIGGRYAVRLFGNSSAGTILSARGVSATIDRFSGTPDTAITEGSMFYAESPNEVNDIGTSTITDMNGLYVSNMQTATGTITNSHGVWVEGQSGGSSSNMGIVLNGDGAGSDIVFGPSQNARIYSSAGELFVEDGASNVTQISPHDPETGEWIFYSKNTKTGKVVKIEMEKLVKAIEKLTGEKFLIETYE